MIANRIYQEFIPRELTYSPQLTISQQPAWHIGSDGRLEMNKLLAEFQQFFRGHSESWVQRFDYAEAGPKLLMQAFLQRIINNGGRVEREYGLGRGRTDLLIIWPYPGLGDVIISYLNERNALKERFFVERSLTVTPANGMGVH